MEEPAVDMNDMQNDDAPEVAEVLLIDHGSDPQEPNVLEIVAEEQEKEETKVTKEEQKQETELIEKQEKELMEEQEREEQEEERKEKEREEQEREEQEEVVREEQEREEQEEDVREETDEQETLVLEPLSKRLARKLPADFQDSNRTPSPAASFTRERLRAARLRRIQQGQLVKT
jgi:outer membrane biosynthesis protein TonB